MEISQPFIVASAAIAVAVVALGLRLFVHLGVKPSGVDTWYYLASADALRLSRRLPISLPQYLLQDRTESYPPGLVVLLALLPRRLLERYFWLLSPLVDVFSLLVLFIFTYRFTEDLWTSVLAGLIYAVVPHLVAETRSLSPRALGGLLGAVAMLLVLRYTVPDQAAATLSLGPTPVLVGIAAVLVIAMMFLTQPTGGIALGVATGVLTLAYGDVRYVAFTFLGFLAAILVARRLYISVLMNHVHAITFWRRNQGHRGSEPIFDSPLYSEGRCAQQRTEFRWRGLHWQLTRLVGENPFILPMIVLPPADDLWGQRVYLWAIAVIALAVLVTVVPMLRPLGPGYIYLKASVFPTAFSLALAVGPRDLPIGTSIIAAAFMSVAGLAVFWVHTRKRTEGTSYLPIGLAEMTRALGRQPHDGVLVLPTMYADYVTYHSGKSVLWGGHSGDLSRFEDLSPVVRRPFRELIQMYDLKYALLDLNYVEPSQIDLAPDLDELARASTFALFEIRPGQRP